MLYIRIAVILLAVFAMSAIGGSTGKSEDMVKAFFAIMTYFGLPALALVFVHSMWGK